MYHISRKISPIIITKKLNGSEKMALTDINQIRSIMERHGFNFSKALGQNFLINPSVCPRMAEEAVENENMGIIEVGPGIGVLTEQLAQRAKKVVCIELDKRLPDILKETLKDFDNISIISGDVLEVDLKGIIENNFKGLAVSVCANLPYYITTPVIMRFLEEKLPITSLIVMVQKEAAQRLCSPPGTRNCGSISAAVFNYCTPTVLFNVSRGSFMPAPNVDSSVIKLSLKEKPFMEENQELFSALVKAAFAQRRKKAVNSISSTLGKDKSLLEKAFVSAGIKETARAEEITLTQWKCLTAILAPMF